MVSFGKAFRPDVHPCYAFINCRRVVEKMGFEGENAPAFMQVLVFTLLQQRVVVWQRGGGSSGGGGDVVKCDHKKSEE